MSALLGVCFSSSPNFARDAILFFVLTDSLAFKPKSGVRLDHCRGPNFRCWRVSCLVWDHMLFSMLNSSWFGIGFA